MFDYQQFAANCLFNSSGSSKGGVSFNRTVSILENIESCAFLNTKI